MAKKKTKKKTRIKDNYSYKEMDMTFGGAKDMQTMYKLAKLTGYSDPNLDDAFKKFEDINKQYSAIKNVPDRFNHFFAQKGWIAFETLSFDLMEKCVKLAEAGKPKEAEDALIEYFTDRDRISFLVTRLNNVQEFRPRRTLMLNALEDHFSGRYHASVPLFLMLIDGFVNDVEQIGFFADKVKLDVWDTIAAHSSGLSAIQKILNKSRRKTTEDEITLPYRNGILHGRDLGYANVNVSAKALSTLLALRDWADAIKKGKKGVNKEFVPPTLEESAEQIASSLEGLAENQRQSEYLNNVWKRRDITVGEDMPAKGELSEYEEETPEKAVMQLLEYITARNYGKLAMMLEFNRKYETVGKLAGKLREVFEGKKLVDYKLVNVYDNASAISEVETELIFEREEDGKQVTDNRTFRLMYQDEEGNPIPRGYKKAEWKFMFDFRNIEYIDFR
ncbi:MULTISPECIES: hypothetical protein [Priestia]|uniref:hypothetical protein n=1 Tax=Priestia TaxID=2800373 RepID=UPI00077C6D11|nr:hypothetical protein [Priestia flexa]MED4590752.1 hypothetical protein [Priestia flexa]